MVEIPEKFRDIIYGGPPRQEEKGHLRGTLSNPNFNHLAISQLRAGMYRILPNAGSVAKHQPRGAWPNFPGHEWSCDHHLHRASQFANSPPQCRGILQLLPPITPPFLPLRPLAHARTAEFYSTFLRAGSEACSARLRLILTRFEGEVEVGCGDIL